MAVAYGPVSIWHVLALALAAHSSGVHLPEAEVLPPVEFGRAHECRTVGFSDRLRQNPTLKIGPVAAGRRRMNQALHSRVLKDSMVTLYSSASSFLIARRATASWFNLSKWSATLKAAPSQLAAAG